MKSFISPEFIIAVAALALIFTVIVCLVQIFRTPPLLKRRFDRAVRRCGLHNAQNEYPMLVGVKRDKNKHHGIILTVKNMGISVPDFDRRIDRLQASLKQGHPPAEYIIAAEPQARGAWHLHCLFLFTEKAPFIPNSDMARIWGHGFTKTKSLKGIDNHGLYLTAYLGDMELSEALRAGSPRGKITEASTIDEQGKRQKKAVIKGARLRLYPPGFNLYRTSRGVKRPEIWQTTEAEAQKMIHGTPLTYEKTIAVTDEAGNVKNIINYRQYNIAAKEGGSLDAAEKAISPEDT